jgi:hypothetical protein
LDLVSRCTLRDIMTTKLIRKFSQIAWNYEKWLVKMEVRNNHKKIIFCTHGLRACATS